MRAYVVMMTVFLSLSNLLEAAPLAGQINPPQSVGWGYVEYLIQRLMDMLGR